MLREARPILYTIKKIKTKFDALLIDGHGQLHPRRCGLASYIGIKLHKPTIGVAKSLLCGTQSGYRIKIDGKTLGRSITANQKSIYISIGNMISLDSAVSITKDLIEPGGWYPKPLYLADKFSKNKRRESS